MAGIVCQSDVNEEFRVMVFGPKKEAAFTNKMNQLVRRHLSRWTDIIRDKGNLTAAKLSRIGSIDIAVRPSRNMLGYAAGSSVTLDEGNLLIGYAVSYANTLFEFGKVTMKEYDLWYQYFIDSIVDGDPIVYPLGTQDFMHFIRSTGGLDDTVSSSFIANLNPWIAMTVFHEVAHVVLNHGSRLQDRFPTLAQRHVSQWTPEEFEFNRKLEREADKEALDLYMSQAGFDPSRGLVYWVLWPILRREAITHIRRRAVYPTHPEPRERATEVMSYFLELTGSDRKAQNDYSGHLDELIRDLTRRIREGRRPIDHIPIEVPPGTPESLRRFFKRDCHLRQLPRLRDARAEKLLNSRIEPGDWMEIEM
jgi:hypothetical protein